MIKSGYSPVFLLCPVSSGRYIVPLRVDWNELLEPFGESLVYRRVWRPRKWRGVQGVPLQDIGMSWLLLPVSGVFF